MKREGYFSNWKKITVVSFGVVYIFFNLWVIFHIPEFVPKEQEAMWFKIFISYGILNSVIFANANMRNKLFNVKLTKFLPRFALFFVVFLLIFYYMFKKVDILHGSAFQLLGNIPLWLGTIHALTFATTESVVWQGFLDYEIGHPWSEITAGIFHWGIWSGSTFVVIISAGLLFMFFSLINWWFRKNKNDLAPAIGCHTAYNFVHLGMIVGGVAI